MKDIIHAVKYIGIKSQGFIQFLYFETINI